MLSPDEVRPADEVFEVFPRLFLGNLMPCTIIYLCYVFFITYQFVKSLFFCVICIDPDLTSSSIFLDG